MYVYDGNSAFAPQIGNLTGIPPYNPENIVSTGPHIYISFITDETETASGFIIMYDAGENSLLS